MPSPTTHQPRISLIAGIILIVVTLLTGVAVFVVMQRNAEALLSKSLQLSLQNRVQLTHTEIRAGFERTVLISTRPLLIDQLQFVDARANGTTPHSFAAAHGLFVDARADGTATQNKLNMAVGSLLENELTAVAFYGKDGQELARAGVFTQQPELVVPLNNFPGSVQLLWDGQLFLRAVVEMKKEGRVIGKVMTETSLSVTRGALKDASLLGETGELVLCAPFSLNMQCFPSTRLPNVLTRSQHSARGDPLPMAHALAGETGFVTARDYRDQVVVAAYAPVGDLGLGMVLKMDSAELHAPVWDQLRYLIPLLAGVLVIALLLLRWRLTPLVLRLVLSEAQARELSASLRDSEIMSRCTTENMAESVITTTTDDIVLEANKAALQLFGYEKSELIGRDVSELVPERHRRQYKDTTAALAAQPEAFNIHGREIRSLRKNGSEFKASTSFSDVQVGGRRLFTAMILDITERKQAEESLSDLRRELELIMDSMGEGVQGVDLEGNITFENSAAARMLGWKVSELRGRPGHLTIHHTRPDGTPYPKEECPIYATFDDGVSRQVADEVFWRQDGTSFPVEYSTTPMRNDQNEIVGCVVTFRDITERKQTEEMLRASESRYRQLVQNSPYCIHEIDRLGRLISMNPAGLTMMCVLDEREILGMPYLDIVADSDKDRISRLLDLALQGRSSEFEFVATNKSHFESSLVPILNEAGVVQRLMGLTQDITERKQAANEILRAQVAMALADQANSAKSAFLANMSHEIRTPMNSIMGMAHLALKTELSPKQRDYIAKIQYSSRHLLGIINDILDFSKIEASQLVLETLDVDLPTMVRDISSQLGDSATAKGLGLVCDIDPQLSQPLRGDPLRLRQILLNYIDNAIKFTHQGKIIVSARILEETAGDRLVRFEVQDTGIGMREAEVADLFLAFHQADASTTRTYGGTGLGLAISKQLAALMGGEVGVESRPSQGSTFWFTARLGRGTDQAAMAQAARPPVDLSLIKGAAVLLVEDNLFNQQVARELLEEAGAAVTIVNNGQEAIDWLLQAHCDCVLMDIQMPVMDGLEATRQIRANPALSSTPVIGLTANAGQEDQAHCFQAGMNDVVSKPFEPDRLLAVLATWLAQQPGQSQPAHAASTAAARPLPPVAVSEAAAGDASVIDLAVLANIVSPNPEKIRKYALMFVSSMHATMAEVEATLAHADMVGVAALGHRAKSSARMVGAMGFADLCQALEQCQQAGDYDKACGIVAHMRPLLARISEQIDKEFNE